MMYYSNGKTHGRTNFYNYSDFTESIHAYEIMGIRKGENTMGKAIVTAIITLIVGVFCMVIGYELLGGFAEFGTIAAVAVAGGLVVYFENKKK